ncbi:Ribonuclease 1 [Hondaea fermentalgiana]|uniref:Ribonuclease 1 n=1 Tax=Hondaea fermentalgiana TaxID=2315210 RepID=A0A2R5GH16_9STRA|nr:Ribonuclease 1 [Hondaea fermentalgiana]|eukprot:GBG27561.1 Ribonuclease 1 [Hondaea fermentalgiana]
MARYAHLVALVLLALAQAKTVQAGCDSRGDGSFDFFMMAIQWPPEFEVPRGWFSLHGLWPSRFGTQTANTYPCECSSEAFDKDSLSDDVQMEMRKFWGTLIGHNSNEHFWSHEWSKHGTCSAMSQPTYFNSTLDARARYDPLRAFEAAGIKPSDTDSFDAETLEAAFQATYGVKPMLGCRNRSGRQLLSEMGLCLDKSLAISECHSSVTRIHDEVNNCHTSRPIWFLPPDSVRDSAPIAQEEA